MTFMLIYADFIVEYLGFNLIEFSHFCALYLMKYQQPLDGAKLKIFALQFNLPKKFLKMFPNLKMSLRYPQLDI